MNDVDYVNLALNNLGAEQIVALEASDSAAAAMAVPIYQFTLEVLLASHSWRFATSRVQLSRLTTTPTDTRYPYEYALPVNTFRIIRTSIRGDDWMLYRNAESGYRVLCSASPAVWADITTISDSSLFPPHFQQALVAALTAALALPITRRAEVKQVMDAAAMAARAAAITHDWNEQPWPELDDGNAILDSRYGGSSSGTVEFE